MAADPVVDGDTRLRLVPGVDVVQARPDELHLISDLVSLRLEGSSARLVGARILGRLNGTTSVHELTAG